MKVLVTGAGGFLGQRCAAALLADDSPLSVTRLELTDLAAPPVPSDPRASSRPADLTAPGAAAALLQPDTDVVLHLAAAVSGHAEAELEAGLRINLDATRALLDAARAVNPAMRFVFASSVAVYGGSPPPPLAREDCAPTPRSSYGAAKAMCELLACDYARRGLLDARVLRLPTVCVRDVPANRAVTSYASAMVRDALQGRAVVVPVPPEQALWLCSPRHVVRNLLHAAALPRAAWPAPPVLNLPGLRATAADAAAALPAAAAARLRWQPDAAVQRIVVSLPDRVDASRALALGFTADRDFHEIVSIYEEELNINDNRADKIKELS